VDRRRVGGSSVIESKLDIAIEERETGIHFDVFQRGIHRKHVSHQTRAEERLEL
jgi:hypothetical protein